MIRCGNIKQIVNQFRLKQQFPTKGDHTLDLMRNRVKNERKAAKQIKYYQSKFEHLNDTNPKKWWWICKNICCKNWLLKNFRYLLAESICYLTLSSKNKVYLQYGKRRTSFPYQKASKLKNLIKISGRISLRRLCLRSLKNMIHHWM